MFQRFHQYRIAKPDAASQQVAFADAIAAINDDIAKAFRHGFVHYPENWEDGICSFGPPIVTRNPKITNITLLVIPDRDSMSHHRDFEVRVQVEFTP